MNSFKASGFTLIELLVVLAILGMIMGLVGPRIMKHFNEAKADTTRLQIKELEAALDLFDLQTGRYPLTEEGLQALIEKPAGLDKWNGPYLKNKQVPLDSWGHPFNYQSPGKNGPYDLFSYGADNLPGGDGNDRDVTSWE